MKVPGVKAVITGKDLEAAGLGWLPTFHGFDKQMVLAIGKVLFQYQEVAAVFAETRDARRPTAPKRCRSSTSRCRSWPIRSPPRRTKCILRPDREKKTNHIYHWEVGDRDGTAQALEGSAEAR